MNIFKNVIFDILLLYNYELGIGHWATDQNPHIYLVLYRTAVPGTPYSLPKTKGLIVHDLLSANNTVHIFGLLASRYPEQSRTAVPWYCMYIYHLPRY